MQHPGGEQPVSPLGREGGGQPVAARSEHVPRELDESAASEPAVGLQPEREPVARPEFGPEHAEGEIGIRNEAVEHPPPGSPVARDMTVELLRVRVRAAEQKRRIAVRIERRSWILGVPVLEPASRQLVAELRVRRAADPERMPGAEDIVLEPGVGELRRLNGPTKVLAALEHANVPPAPRQQRGASERIDAAADEDRVVVGHERDRMLASRGQARRTARARRGLSSGRHSRQPCWTSPLRQDAATAASPAAGHEGTPGG